MAGPLAGIKVVEMGVTDRDHIGVGGHSYGAFMTANLLAHSRLFRAGAARRSSVSGLNESPSTATTASPASPTSLAKVISFPRGLRA